MKTSASVQAILDQISKTTMKGNSKTDDEMDRLRLMAKKVNSELVNEELIRSLGKAVQTSAEDQYVRQPTASEASSANGASASSGNATDRSNFPAYASQMQAYRENA